MMPRRFPVLSFAALSFLLPAASVAQKPDTSDAKRALLSLAQAQSDAVGRGGVRTLFAAAMPTTLFLFPSLPIADRQVASATLTARYANRGVMQTPQHAVASADGLIGCVVGLTRVWPLDNAIRDVRFGRYATCWRRASRSERWVMLVHAQNGEEAGGEPMERDLAGAPHSVDAAAQPAGASFGLRADAAFSKASVDSGPSYAFREFAAGDAMLLAARARPRRGPEETGAAFRPKAEAPEVSWVPRADFVAETGGLALTVGDATIRSGSQTSRTKYLTVWRRESDGRWKYIFDLGSGQP